MNIRPNISQNNSNGWENIFKGVYSFKGSVKYFLFERHERSAKRTDVS